MGVVPAGVGEWAVLGGRVGEEMEVMVVAHQVVVLGVMAGARGGRASWQVRERGASGAEGVGGWGGWGVGWVVGLGWAVVATLLVAMVGGNTGAWPGAHRGTVAAAGQVH